METIKQAVANAISELPDTANFRDIQAVLETLRQEFHNNTAGGITETKAISFLEAAKEYVGCIKDGPPDLSTNKAYFEGFGL